MARHYPLCAILDSNAASIPAYPQLGKKFDLVAGYSSFKNKGGIISQLEQLEDIHNRNENWYLGYLTYDIKNQIENLYSHHADGINWPPLFFFQPDLLITVENDRLTLYSTRQGVSFSDVMDQLNQPAPHELELKLPEMKSRTGKEEYLQKVKKLQEHIHRGDIYEVNFCMEFFEHAAIDPYQTYDYITRHSPAPFSVFFKHQEHFLLSASPERFLRKDQNMLLSQPIKGTAPRSHSPLEDEGNRYQLKNSLKERTENIMITDLVRNDLSRIACKNSVRVEELCGVYAYPHVYQMISTISAKVEDPSFLDIVNATFPMGSMTGAPKIKAMQLIEEYEGMKRGLYAGAVGYIAPGMDFDLNVVIRSMQYNARSDYLSYMAGSAITALSVPENEYRECLLKAYAINPQLRPAEHA